MSLEGTVNSLVVWEQGGRVSGCNAGGCRAHPPRPSWTPDSTFSYLVVLLFALLHLDLFIKSSVAANNSSEINSLLEMWDLDFVIDGKSNGFFIWKKDSGEHWR